MSCSRQRRGGGSVALTAPIVVAAVFALSWSSAASARLVGASRRAGTGEGSARGAESRPVAAWRDSIRAFAEAHLQHTAWGPAHARRDYETTLALARAEKITVDDDALYAAAYLHDMGGIPPYAIPGVDHGDRSIQLVDSILRGAGFPMEKAPLVKEIIDHHQYYRPPDTLAVAILFRDADILDFLGAIDIARILSLTTRERFTPDLPHAIDVIRKNMLEMPALLQTNAARREAQHRIREMQSFLDALAAESDSLRNL